MYTVFLLHNLKVRDHSEDVGVGGDNLRLDHMEIVGKRWTGFIWLRIGTSDRFL
jgi:hypothetical protein